jgi:tetratricopeptide (TPR) repeat protein
MSTRLTGRLAILLTFGAACAPSHPTAYARGAAEASRAYAHGRYAEAARSWERAARVADRPSDRAEALYRRAASLGRERSWEAARMAFRDLVARLPESGRAPRALYESARISARLGARSEARTELETVIWRYPNSAVAPNALRRLLAVHRDESEDEAIRFLTALSQREKATRLQEHIRYALARSLERAGRRAEAHAAYLETARRFPYPKGSFWDDSLWRAAGLELEAGDPHQAVETLQRMLRAREASHGAGSYERPRYSEARMRIAEIHRDALDDPKAARAEFEGLWRDHPTSRLRDDALWQAALLSLKLGDRSRACRDARLLTEKAPDSRYVPCTPLICPAMTGREKSCSDGIREAIPKPAVPGALL